MQTFTSRFRGNVFACSLLSVRIQFGPEGCGGIWVFNEQFGEFGALFTVRELNERLASLATVLIPAR